MGISAGERRFRADDGSATVSSGSCEESREKSVVAEIGKRAPHELIYMDENFSTDVEPMAGGHGDQYLRALGEQARAFKRGV